MTDKLKLPRGRKTLAGGLQWYVGSDLFVQWWGEGSGLVLASTKPGGILTSILFEGYRKPFATFAEATAGFAEFFKRAQSQ